MGGNLGPAGAERPLGELHAAQARVAGRDRAVDQADANGARRAPSDGRAAVRGLSTFLIKVVEVVLPLRIERPQGAHRLARRDAGRRDQGDAFQPELRRRYPRAHRESGPVGGGEGARRGGQRQRLAADHRRAALVGLHRVGVFADERLGGQPARVAERAGGRRLHSARQVADSGNRRLQRLKRAAWHPDGRAAQGAAQAAAQLCGCRRRQRQGDGDDGPAEPAGGGLVHAAHLKAWLFHAV